MDIIIDITTDTNGVIKKMIVTRAKIHDSTQFDALIEDEEKPSLTI